MNCVSTRIVVGVLAMGIVMMLAGAAQAQMLPKKIRRIEPLPPPVIEATKPKSEVQLNPEVREAMANAPLLEAPTVDAFIEALPDWKSRNRIKPSAKKETPEGQKPETIEGRKYTVVTTKYSLTETPQEIVTFQPVNAFWLGALVQEQGLQKGIGSMEEIPVLTEKRAPLKILSDLPGGGNFRTITAPSASNVGSAIGDLMQKGNSLKTGISFHGTIVENYSEVQTAQELGINARYMTAELTASLKTDRSSKNHTITAAFVEKALTVSLDLDGRTGRAAFFNDAFSIEDAHALVNQKRISASNLPAYINSITYGRVVLFNLTSTLSESEMRGALDASVEGGTWSATANANFNEKLKTAHFQLRVTQIGGTQDGISKLFPATGIENVLAVMNSYLQKPAPLSSMKPISYTVNTLRDNQLAAMSLTTEYSVTKYIAHPIGDRYRIKMWYESTTSDDGVGDNTLECYGELRVNGDLWWSIDRDHVVKREAGQTLEISEDVGGRKPADRKFVFDYHYDGSTPFQFELRLHDTDDRSEDDDIGIYSGTLDLPAIAGKNTDFDWDSGKGESGWLRIRVERVDSF